LSVVLLITPLRSNLASTAKHHASAVDAMVRSCVSRARESVDEALGRTERDNDSTSTCAAARVKFEFGSVREPETTPLPDRRHFLPTRARDEILLLGVFSRVASRYKASRSPAYAVLARRASSSPARCVSAPRSRPATGDRARSRRFERASPGSPRDVFFQTRDARASSSRGASKKGREDL